MAINGDVKAIRRALAGENTSSRADISGDVKAIRQIIENGGGGGGGTDANAVHYSADSGKTTSQKTQARTNIGSASESDLTAEVSRAEAAEQSNATSITNLGQQIGSKVADATENGISIVNENHVAAITHDEELNSTSEKSPMTKAVYAADVAIQNLITALTTRTGTLEGLQVQMTTGTVLLKALVGILASKGYVDNAIAGSKGLKPTGFVQSAAPTQGLSDGDVWYEGTSLPTVYPISVKTYSGSAWSTDTTSYTPMAGDVLQVTDASGATSTAIADANGGWIVLGGTAFNPDTQTITLNQAEQACVSEGAKGSSVGLTIANFLYSLQYQLDNTIAKYPMAVGHILAANDPTEGMSLSRDGITSTTVPSDYEYDFIQRGATNVAYKITCVSGLLTWVDVTTPANNITLLNADGTVPDGVEYPWVFPDGLLTAETPYTGDPSTETRYQWVRIATVKSLAATRGDNTGLLTDAKVIVDAINELYNLARTIEVDNFDFDAMHPLLGIGMGHDTHTDYAPETMQYTPTKNNGFDGLAKEYRSHAGDDSIFTVQFEHDTQNIWMIVQYRDHTSDAESYTRSGTITPESGGDPVACHIAEWLQAGTVFDGSLDLETVRSHGTGFHTVHYDKGTTGLPTAVADQDCLGLTYTADETINEESIAVVHMWLVGLKTGNSYSIRSNGEDTGWTTGVPTQDMWHFLTVEDVDGNEWPFAADGNMQAPAATDTQMGLIKLSDIPKHGYITWDASVAFTWANIKAACGGSAGLYKIIVDGTPTGVPTNAWGYANVNIDTNGYGTVEFYGENGVQYSSQQLASGATTIRWHVMSSSVAATTTISYAGISLKIYRQGGTVWLLDGEATITANVAYNTTLGNLPIGYRPREFAKGVMYTGGSTVGTLIGPVNINTNGDVIYYGGDIAAGGYMQMISTSWPTDDVWPS